MRRQRALVLASDIRRLTAALVDGLAVWLISILLWWLGLGGIGAWVPAGDPGFWPEHVLGAWNVSPVSVLTPLLTPLLVGGLWQAGWKGQTPGKRLLSLRVTDAEGDDLATWQILTRAAAWMLSWGALGVGILMVYVSHERRSLHDWLSDTRVLSTSRTSASRNPPASGS